uniref:Uncharacterized protein n=1 Tax=Citrobacter freundii TaxID=546 RepID=A0A7T8TIY8_CITFR|nr:hypothetical protein JJQ52_00030 [Citrobacter freundii]
MTDNPTGKHNEKTASLLMLTTWPLPLPPLAPLPGTLSVHILDQQTDAAIVRYRHAGKQQQDKWTPIASGNRP